MIGVNAINIEFSDQWVQAMKTGSVINFNRWRDWNGKQLRGVDWYKEEENTEYQGTILLK